MSLGVNCYVTQKMSPVLIPGLILTICRLPVRQHSAPTQWVGAKIGPTVDDVVIFISHRNQVSVDPTTATL
jgi:hypothetical protein